MNGEILFLIITYILCFVSMTIWVYIKLKRPFTLTDLLFYPDDKVMSRIWSDRCDVQSVSVLKWMPIINLLICSGFILACLSLYVIISVRWLYNRILKRITDKIVFK